MAIPTIFDTCRPRPDVLDGTVADADFAADLASVLTGRATAAYREPGLFFANTYPTRGLRNLVANVCRRLSGTGDSVGAIFRLDTSYGGGKTHGLIALAHAARGMRGVPNVGEFVDPTLLPVGSVRVAAFDGESADPMNGRALSGGVLAYTPWGEIAHALAGNAGYERVRSSDEKRVAPGSDTLRALFGDEPTLILLDELSVYLRKVAPLRDAQGQLTAFLTSLFKAVEAAPNAALVYTLAVGKDGRATDAYSAENQLVADRMAEIEKVSARKATLLNPTEADETVQVLRRRLFEHIDDARAKPAVDAYRELWSGHPDALGADAARPETVDEFRASYPFHPHVLETLTGKTATLANFQRVRGMLRLLARTVAHLWRQRPTDATAVHLHHMDPGYEPIRQEIVTRLGQGAFVPAIINDVAAGRTDQRALAEDIDAQHHQGLPPYAAYVARTIFMHTLAFNDPLKGLMPEQLRYAAAGPAVDPGFIDEARKRFVAESAYLDDRPAAPMRFLAEANLSVIIRREEQHVDPGEARSQLNDRIRDIFGGKTFELVPFPGGPFDVPDELGDGRPKLVVFSYDGLAVGEAVDEVPELIERVYARKGADGSALRVLRNHLVFVVADERASDAMRHRMRSRLALQRLKAPDRLVDLVEHQQEKIRALEARSEQELAIAIQQCYRHVFYPSRTRLGTRGVDLAHTAIDIPSASNQPGAGQKQIATTLRALKKLRSPGDEPDAPAYVRDRTPLRKGQMTTFALRDEFRRDPTLPILIGDDIFIHGIRRGIETGEYVYRRGDLLFGPGDADADIRIDSQAVVMTMAYAKNKAIWPRSQPQQAPSGTGQAPDLPGLGPTVPPAGTDPPVPPPGVDPAPPGTDPVPPPPGPGPVPPGPGPTPPPPVHPPFTAEGVLKEALVQLWEQARAKRVAAIRTLTIRMFDASDAFRLLGAVGSVSGAERVVVLAGGYQTRDGSTFELEFRGRVSDAQPVKEFLEPQLRDASDKTVEATFELTFEKGLLMQGNAADDLTNRLCRFASGAAYVSATAEAKS